MKPLRSQLLAPLSDGKAASATTTSKEHTGSMLRRVCIAGSASDQTRSSTKSRRSANIRYRFAGARHYSIEIPRWA